MPNPCFRPAACGDHCFPCSSSNQMLFQQGWFGCQAAQFFPFCQHLLGDLRRLQPTCSFSLRKVLLRRFWTRWGAKTCSLCCCIQLGCMYMSYGTTRPKASRQAKASMWLVLCKFRWPCVKTWPGYGEAMINPKEKTNALTPRHLSRILKGSDIKVHEMFFPTQRVHIEGFLW